MGDSGLPLQDGEEVVHQRDGILMGSLYLAPRMLRSGVLQVGEEVAQEGGEEGIVEFTCTTMSSGIHYMSLATERAALGCTIVM